MIYKTALKYVGTNNLFEIDDLLQEGYFIFCENIDKFDIDKQYGCSFETYLFNGLCWGFSKLTTGGSSRGKGNLKLLRNCVSLNEVCNDGDGDELFELVEDRSIADDFNLPEKLFWEDIHKRIDIAMNKLTLQQREIIVSRVGYYQPKMTLEELADILCKTRARVLQIEEMAKRRLRNDSGLFSAAKELDYEWIRELAELNEKRKKACKEEYI